MKVLLGQINTTPGDFDGNVSKILNVLGTIKLDGDVKINKVDMVVFPELSICGYLSRDLIFETHYVERNLSSLQQIINASNNIREVSIVVGYVDHNKTGVGKPFANMLAVIRNGAIIGTYQKHLLPFYDVFDEGRYYEPGTQLLVLNIAGEKVGFTICEDIWNDKGSDGYNYEDNPIARYKKLGIKTIVNISSSPFIHNKPHKRLKMLKSISCENRSLSCESGYEAINGITIIYVNQIGGQDDLVFDGHSCVIRNGNVVDCIHPAENPWETVQIKYIDTNGATNYIIHESTAVSYEAHVKNIHNMVIKGLYDYVSKSGFRQIVLGSSGGIDSAVVAALACEAFGPENVHCIMMPSVFSSEGSIKDAQELHKNLGCKEYEIPIDHEYVSHSLKCAIGLEKLYGADLSGSVPKNIFKSIQDYNASADENIQARMRGMYVMYFSNALGILPLTTGNKTELATGYCTLYGDMNGGFAPISDLYKMEVYGLARYINEIHKKEIIPKSILNKAPSAELSPGQTDEASLLPYPILDKVVKSYVENYIDTFESLKNYYTVNMSPVNSINYLCEVPMIKWLESENASKDYYRIIKLININEFKRRQAAPGIKLSKVAFGSGRRLPIVKKMRI